VRRYLIGFGPASPKDIEDWVGMNISDVRPTIERLTLRRFRAESGRELVDLPRAPLPGGDAPAPVRFIPTWDATLLVHARRTQIPPSGSAASSSTRRHPTRPTPSLVDGRVAGTWAADRGRVGWRPFEPLPARARRELDEEAGELAAFIS
jgi:hypothetical protein